LGASLSDGVKFNGGILGQDGSIYCIPNGATTILSIKKNQAVPAFPLKIALSPHINKL